MTVIHGKVHEGITGIILFSEKLENWGFIFEFGLEVGVTMFSFDDDIDEDKNRMMNGMTKQFFVLFCLFLRFHFLRLRLFVKAAKKTKVNCNLFVLCSVIATCPSALIYCYRVSFCCCLVACQTNDNDFRFLIVCSFVPHQSGSISEVSQASSDLASAVHSNHTNHQQQVQVDVEPCVTPTKNGGGGGDLSRATSSVSGTASVEDLGASGQSSWSPSSPHPLASASVAAAVSSSTTTSSSLNHTDHHHSSYHSSSPSTTPSSSNDGHGRGSPTNSQSSATLPPASPPHSNNTGASGQLFQSNSIISSNGSEGKNSLHSSSNGGSVERINGNGTSQVNGNHSSLSASPSAEGGGSVDSLSGDFLNLNMTASQMRALLAQRKKKNIKEDNIDIMEKFRKLQQL